MRGDLPQRSFTRGEYGEKTGPGAILNAVHSPAREIHQVRIVIFLAVVGGVIIVALGLAAWYDHRAKRRGGRVGASTEEALQNRMDLEMNNPMVQGGNEDWMTWRRRDQK